MDIINEEQNQFDLSFVDKYNEQPNYSDTNSRKSMRNTLQDKTINGDDDSSVIKSESLGSEFRDDNALGNAPPVPIKFRNNTTTKKLRRI